MTLAYIGLVPLAAVVCSLSGIFVSYGISIHNNHTDKWLPFISDTGNLSPESCIFGQLLNLSALFRASVSLSLFLMQSSC